MSFEPVSTNQPPLFSGMEAEGFGAPSPAPVKSARSRNRAAWWRQDLDRTALYLMGQARMEDERAFVERLYEQAVVILNALPPQATSLIAEARDAVAVHGLELAPVTIHQRAAYAHSLIDGHVAMEFDPKGKAADEITKLYQWLEKQLKI